MFDANEGQFADGYMELFDKDFNFKSRFDGDFNAKGQCTSGTFATYTTAADNITTESVLTSSNGGEFEYDDDYTARLAATPLER